jgi:hypothetical protein
VGAVEPVPGFCILFKLVGQYYWSH